MNRLTLKNIGPIREARVEFGDLTVLVGPQASGKSIALQFLKLAIDKGRIHEQMTRYGVDWSGNERSFLDAYFGEGMHAIWGGRSAFEVDGSEKSLATLARRGRSEADERVFMVPAQRVLALRNGWPRPFTDYSPGDPYSVRDFSEKLRNLVEQEFGSREQLFPQQRRLKRELRDLLNSHVFGDFRLEIHRLASQKRLVLKRGDNGADPLPNMVWSAGQREFVPLLLGLYWLMPPTKTSRRGQIEWVVLEEIEMGLHPSAINIAMVMVLELVQRGYRVCVSTHSGQILEAVWAIRRLQEVQAQPRSLLDLFGCPNTQTLRDVAASVLSKRLAVHYFDRSSGKSRDISRLDPGAEAQVEADWGGLSTFSRRANEAVAAAVAAAEGRR